MLLLSLLCRMGIKVFLSSHSFIFTQRDVDFRFTLGKGLHPPSLPISVSIALAQGCGGRQTPAVKLPAVLFSALLLPPGLLCKKVKFPFRAISVSALCFSSFLIFLPPDVATRMIYTSASPAVLT